MEREREGESSGMQMNFPSAMATVLLSLSELLYCGKRKKKNMATDNWRT